MLKNLPKAHRFEADLEFISSDKVSPLPWAGQQPLYHMVYETSVQQGRAAPAGFIISVASQAKLTALSPCSFWLPHRLKPSVITPHPCSTFQGSGLFVPTLSGRGEVVQCWCKELVSFTAGVLSSAAAAAQSLTRSPALPPASRDLPITQPTQTSD